MPQHSEAKPETLDQVAARLLDKVKAEPIPPAIRDLAEKLDQTLSDAHKKDAAGKP